MVSHGGDFLCAFQGHFRRRLGKRRENPPRVKPSRALFSENFVPSNLSGLQLRHGGVSAVVTSQRRPHTETALGKIQSVPRRPPHPVVLHPSHQRRVHSSLINQVLEQPPHRIVRKRRHHGRVQPEAARSEEHTSELQSLRHLVCRLLLEK